MPRVRTEGSSTPSLPSGGEVRSDSEDSKRSRFHDYGAPDRQRKESAEKRAEYWQANHDFTIETLNEDFDLGEGIQKSLESGANETLRFGRFESALAHFNDEVDARVAG